MFNNEVISLAKQQDLIEQLADLLDSGLPLKQSLKLLGRQNARTELLFRKLLLHLQSGLLFSEAIKKEQVYFDPLLFFFVSMGENSGDLPKSLRSFTDQLKARASVTEQIKKQMFYPALVLSAALLSLFLMGNFLLPTMSDLFVQSQIAVPPFLSFLLNIRTFVCRYILLLLFLCGGFAFYLCHQNKDILEELLQRSPLIRQWSQKIFLWRLLQNLSVLLQAGVPLLESILLQKELFAGKIARQKLELLVFQIKNGNSLSSSLAKERWADPALLEIVQVAEHSGALPSALDKLAQMLGKELEQTTALFLKWLEPATTLLLGALVTLLLLGLFYPLTKILSSLG